jgi:hypothetical protein
MRRILSVFAVGLYVGVSAAYGGSSLQALAHHWAKYFGDAHAVVVRIEKVRIEGARPGHERWAMIRIKGHHPFKVGCPRSGPGPMGACGAHYLELGVDLSNHEVGLFWGLTTSEVHAIARARHASKWLRIFPDTPALNTRCAIPRGGFYRGRDKTLSGTCSTVAQPSDHVRRVEFDETFRISPSSKLNSATWTVIFNRTGRVQSIRVNGQPPQLWK